MKTFALLMASLLMANVAHAADNGDPLSGKKLFEESRCLSCHAATVFTKPDRKVKSLAQLESQVRTCDANLSTNWFDDQIIDVVAYLNQTYYKFPNPVRTQ